MGDEDYEARLTATGRNDSCPCGSGKKYKKCHLAADERARSAALQALEEEAKARAAAEAEEAAEEADKGAATKGKPGDQRPKAPPVAPSQGADVKPKNIPRRGAI